LEPGIFFAINSPAAALGADAAQTISSWGFPLENSTMQNLADQMGEKTLFSRTGGAPSLAVGMANIFSSAFGNNMLSMWYHFAIMFEAIFILTTLDAGTRVARFMLEDLLKFRDRKLHESAIASLFSSFLIVGAWGYFLYMGVLDPNGGVNILWPLFGMSNQMLAGIALTLVTVIIYKSERRKFFFITAIPLCFLLATISWAVIEKVFSTDVKIGFLALAKATQFKIDSGLIANDQISNMRRMIFNQKLVSGIALSFMAILWVVVADAVRSCVKIKK
jgi:carbon starvation protein